MHRPTVGREPESLRNQVPPSNGVTLTASQGPKLSRKFLFVHSSELIVGSLFEISIENFDAEALFPESNIWSKVGTALPC